MDRKLYVIITAGGVGKRMGADVPKQFLEIDGKPILRLSIEPFLQMPNLADVIVVLPDEWKDRWRDYCDKSDFLPRYICPSGGITRFHSVKNALEYVRPGALVAVHDGVRPFVRPDFINGMIRLAQADNVLALVPVLKLTETIRVLDEDGDGSHTVDRNRFVSVQTPQVFHSEVLLDSYSRPYSPAFTDDASVVEARGYRVTLCSGQRGNIKITVPEDLKR
jgi:2-C-methyl-D-erythritol 4-phosphate cytidylyltransferase